LKIELLQPNSLSTADEQGGAAETHGGIDRVRFDTERQAVPVQLGKSAAPDYDTMKGRIKEPNWDVLD
jgi:hypothetical protein